MTKKSTKKKGFTRARKAAGKLLRGKQISLRENNDACREIMQALADGFSPSAILSEVFRK